jgi:selenocysteine-specific elongation factor
MSLFSRLFPPRNVAPAEDAALRLAEALALHQGGDTLAALTIWTPLAEAGEPRALNAIGALYLNGDGVTRDEAHGAMLIRRAAEAGMTAAMRNLALLYYEGRGVPQDHKVAADWYERAAAQGDSDAADMASWMYLVGGGVGVVIDGPWLRLPGHEVRLSAEDERLWRLIEAAIRNERFRPPRVRDLATALDVEEEEMRNLMRRLVRLGRVVEVAHDHYFLRGTVAEMIRIAGDIAETAPGAEITAAVFRDRIDSGRKVAIQILEFFDRQGVTIRRGDRRRVRPDRLTYFGDVA